MSLSEFYDIQTAGKISILDQSCSAIDTITFLFFNDIIYSYKEL